MFTGVLMKLVGFQDGWAMRPVYQIYNMSNLNNILEKNPVSFTNVRHPFERLVSGYLHLRHHLEELKGKTFKQFVSEYLLPAAKASRNKKTYERMNPHFKPTNAFCAFCNINYKVISKTETFTEDKGRIMEMMGIEDHEVRLNVNGGNAITNFTKACFSNLTKEQRSAVLELYKNDFDMFNYDPYLYL